LIVDGWELIVDEKGLGFTPSAPLPRYGLGREGGGARLALVPRSQRLLPPITSRPNPWISLVAVTVNQRSEIHQFGLDVK